jgi:L-aminopeptidase/D-esterase-like protein
MGYVTPAGPVPIVVALALFDLLVGDPSVRPGAEEGYAACVAASDGAVAVGQVGAGTGATVAGGSPVAEQVPLALRRPGGLVTAGARVGDLVVAALVAVNASGMPGGDDAMALDIARAVPPSRATAATMSGTTGSGLTGLGNAGFGNTTVGLVATNAELDKMGCHLVAQGAHDGLARAIFPTHTRSDGDAFVAAAVGGATAALDVVRSLGVHVVTRAIASLVEREPPDVDR